MDVGSHGCGAGSGQSPLYPSKSCGAGLEFLVVVTPGTAAGVGLSLLLHGG